MEKANEKPAVARPHRAGCPKSVVALENGAVAAPDDKHTRLPLRPCASRIAEWLSTAKLGERRQSVRGVSIFVPVEKCSASLGHRGVEAKFRNVKKRRHHLVLSCEGIVEPTWPRARPRGGRPSSGSGADQSVGQAEHHEREREHRNRRDGIF
jgi:hypothetical protein